MKMTVESKEKRSGSKGTKGQLSSEFSVVTGEGGNWKEHKPVAVGGLEMGYKQKLMNI